MYENILVTGGAGYIGSHVCHTLMEAGYCPVTIDNLCLGDRDFVRWGPLVVGDVRDTRCVAEVISSYRISAVMHFAAYADVGESMNEPLKYYDNNASGTISLLRAMEQTGVRKLVFSSTCAVYGSPARLPIDEDTPVMPVSPYGRSKLLCEAVLGDYAASGGIDYIALRYFNASGATPTVGLGEKRLGTRLIPRAIAAVLGRLDDFTINGADFPTPDGTAVRDFIHVEDLAEAHVRALRRLLHDGLRACRQLNLGTGQGYSVRQIVDAISAMAERPVPVNIAPRRPGDPPVVIADCRRAADVLGFAPTRSDLGSIVRSAWEWHLGEFGRSRRIEEHGGQHRSAVSGTAEPES